MQILNIKENDRILVIAPHPDDECIGAGGLLAMYSKQCEVIVLSDGRQGQGDIAPSIEKEIRKKEFQSEMEAAGISSYKMLEYEDGTLMQHTDCLSVIDLSKYSKIFVTGEHDGHTDHTAAYISILTALKYQEIKNLEIYVYEVHTPLRDITHVLDITDVIEKKIEFIQFHQSQLKDLKYDKLAKDLAAYRAVQNRMDNRFIEAYCYVTIQENFECLSVERENMLQKNILFYWVLTRWMRLNISGIHLSDILKSKNYKKIAVYGYAEIGELLCQELLRDKYDVAYVMDKRVRKAGYKNIAVYLPDINLPKVDAVIVTAVYYFGEIEEELLRMGFYNVISFRNLLEEIHL